MYLWMNASIFNNFVWKHSQAIKHYFVHKKMQLFWCRSMELIALLCDVLSFWTSLIEEEDLRPDWKRRILYPNYLAHNTYKYQQQ